MGLGGSWVGYLCLFAWWVCFYSAFAYVGFVVDLCCLRGVAFDLLVWLWGVRLYVLGMAVFFVALICCVYGVAWWWLQVVLLID